jgi:beta-aspartyl-dipeptidase (metallo-type)
LPVFGADGQVVSYDVGDCSALMATVRELVRRGHALERVLPAFTTNVAALLRMRGVGQVGSGCRADVALPSFDAVAVVASEA